MIKQNLHTHSHYCDGKDTIEAMIVTAIDRKFTVLGFSGHGYNRPLDMISMSEEKEACYRRDVLAMKQKYRHRLEIYLGIEQDAIGKRFDHEMYDYIIGSVHFLKCNDTDRPIDHSKEETLAIVREGYGDDFLRFAEAYYKEVARVASMKDMDIIGHLDLLTKFNEAQDMIGFDEPAYIKLVYACIDEIIKHDKIVEINTGAIARGMRRTPYPHITLLRYIAQKQGKICLNSDCHDRNYLDHAYEVCMRMIRSCRFTTMQVCTPNGFKAVPVESFYV